MVVALVEGLVGVCLLLGLLASVLRALVVGLLLLFSLVLVYRHALGLPASSCGCFGSFLELSLHLHLLVNGTLLAFAGLSLRSSAAGQ